MIKYLPNTQKVIGLATRAKSNNGFTINLLKRYKGNDTIRTQAIKHMKDGSWVEQICMDYGNGNTTALTKRTNTDKPFFSIVFKRDGKVAARCIQSGDSFVYEDSRLAFDSKIGQFKRKKFLYRSDDGMGFKMEDGKVVSDKLSVHTMEGIIKNFTHHFYSLG